MAELDERLAPPAAGAAGSPGAGVTPGPAGVAGPPPIERTDMDHTDMDRAGEAAEDRSLLEDLEALYRDGRTYVAAELGYQKTRASFAADRMKSVAIFGGAGAVLALLAGIGLTVGLILSLSTLIGPLLATIVVVAVLLLIAFLCVRKAAGKARELSRAFSSGGENRA